MIKIVLSIGLLFLMCKAEHIHWSSSYDDALKVARKAHMPLMVLLVKKRCSLCHETIQNVFMNHSGIVYLNERVVSVIVMYESKNTYPVELFYSTIFPTLFLVDAQTENFMTKPLYGKEIQKSRILKIVKEL